MTLASFLVVHLTGMVVLCFGSVPALQAAVCSPSSGAPTLKLHAKRKFSFSAIRYLKNYLKFIQGGCMHLDIPRELHTAEQYFSNRKWKIIQENVPSHSNTMHVLHQ
jgi:hypothetical protein